MSKEKEIKFYVESPDGNFRLNWLSWTINRNIKIPKNKSNKDKILYSLAEEYLDKFIEKIRETNALDNFLVIEIPTAKPAVKQFFKILD